MTETSAPIPADLDAFGLSFFQQINKINPTIGIKNPKTPHPKVFFSSSGLITVVLFTLILYLICYHN